MRAHTTVSGLAPLLQLLLYFAVAMKNTPLMIDRVSE